MYVKIDRQLNEIKQIELTSNSTTILLHFAHNTGINYTTEKTSYEIVIGTKPHIPKSMKLGLYRKKHKLFCKDLPSLSHSENILKNQLLDKLLRPQLSHALLEWERYFSRNYSVFEFSKIVGNKQLERTPLKIDSNTVNTWT